MLDLAKPLIDIGDDLTITLSGAAVRVSPSEGLRLAELLTRTSFRRALIEEIDAHELDAKLSARRQQKPRAGR